MVSGKMGRGQKVFKILSIKGVFIVKLKGLIHKYLRSLKSRQVAGTLRMIIREKYKSMLLRKSLFKGIVQLNLM